MTHRDWIARVPRAVCAALLCASAASAWAGKGSSAAAPSDAMERYRAERAACLAGHTGQDRATCLKEAGAALAEARRGRLDRGGDFRANSLARCQPLPAEDRYACEQRMAGAGSVSGSVEGGGIYRELVIRGDGSPSTMR